MKTKSIPFPSLRKHEDIQKKYEKNKKILDEALDHALSAEFKINMYAKVDINISGGIIRASKELFSTVMILGFSPKKDFFGKIAGNILDNVVENFKGLILVYRPLHPLNIVRNIHIVLPRYAEKEPGMADWFERTDRLANVLASNVHFYGNKQTIFSIKDYLTQIKSKNQGQFKEN
ncbi:MAG: hypothetical protein HC906_10990 [Bacteroidales bacterium]|nr:hypothetical protein [Bacteroidales bacterium]